MKLTINQIITEVGEPLNIADLLTLRGLSGKGIAVAVNNKVVKRNDWAETFLHDGDKVTIITAVCGG